jgi:hypothetical protein
MKTYTPLEKRYALLERGDAFESELFCHRTALSSGWRSELAKKNEVRSTRV